MKKIPLIFVGLLLFFSSFAQDKLSVKADKYNLEIKNYFGHSVQIIVDMPNKNETISLSPGETKSVKGRYSKSKFQKTKLICSYNQGNFDKDKLLLTEWKNNKRDSLNKEALVRDSLVYEDFEISIKEGASAEKKSLAERNSIYVNLDPKLKSYLQDIKEKTISDYNDLERTILIDHFDHQVVDSIYAIVQDHLDQSLNGTMINAILYTADKLSRSKRDRVLQTLEAEEYVNSEIARLSLLKNDIRFAETHTYQIYRFLNEFIDFKGRTPDFIISINPLSFGGEMNDFWTLSSDNIYLRNEETEKLAFSNGLINRSLGASLHFPVFREFYFSEKIYSRLHGGLGFTNMAFSLSEEVDFSDNFFSNTPGNNELLALGNPVQFENQQFSVELLFKTYISSFLTVDVFAGYMAQQGGLNFKGTNVSSGHRWTHDYIKITERSNNPFLGWRLGIGTNSFHSGAWLTFGMRIFKIDHENVSDLVITKKGSSTEASYSSGKNFFSHSSIGFSFAF